ncbi:trypco2 family protein [Streptomyces sp. NPDC096079]|uniref:trypco2 family protein n=1 Tax=unclassified Streptomyces TaxID=2593676 RepID=UPI003317E609
MSTIGLAAAIEELRQELYEAQRSGAGQQFAFGVEEAELELQLELRQSLKGDGKLTFGVVTAGGGGERTSVRTHKLKIRLSVSDKAAGGTRPEVNDEETGSWDDEE